MQTNRARRRHHRRGTALVELAMALPLLALVMVLTFFFGYAMTNQQHVMAADRHVAWRRVHGGSGCSDREFNAMFFTGKAAGIEVNSGIGPDDTLEALVESAGQESADAQTLIHRCVTQHWPHGRSVRIRAGFPSTVDFWNRFQGKIAHKHVREGVEWRRGQVSYLDPIRDQFLWELDQEILSIPEASLRDSLRRLYLQRW